MSKAQRSAVSDVLQVVRPKSEPTGKIKGRPTERSKPQAAASEPKMMTTVSLARPFHKRVKMALLESESHDSFTALVEDLLRGYIEAHERKKAKS